MHVPPPNDNGKVFSILVNNSLLIMLSLHEVYEMNAQRGGRSCLSAHLAPGVPTETIETTFGVRVSTKDWCMNLILILIRHALRQAQIEHKDSPKK
jgi:hypothetical protein